MDARVKPAHDDVRARAATRLAPAAPKADHPASGQPETRAMYLTGESIVVILVVGLVAGWLAGKIVQGTGIGLVVGLVRAIINSTIGAVLLLVIIRLVRRGGRW